MRGVPESVDPDQITSVLSYIFNNLLERPADTLIDFERAHRALRPRPCESAPPRDIISCLPYYKFKEEVLAQARQNELISFNEHKITLFQDLSPITLGYRRALHPLLEVLREHSFSYRWKFPFALSVTHNGNQHILKTPDDLPMFCEALQIPPMDLPDWYREFRFPKLSHSPPVALHSTPTNMCLKGGNSKNNKEQIHHDQPR